MTAPESILRGEGWREEGRRQKAEGRRERAGEEGKVKSQK
jgi:hypothetical protein